MQKSVNRWSIILLNFIIPIKKYNSIDISAIYWYIINVGPDFLGPVLKENDYGF